MGKIYISDDGRNFMRDGKELLFYATHFGLRYTTHPSMNGQITWILGSCKTTMLCSSMR